MRRMLNVTVVLAATLAFACSTSSGDSAQKDGIGADGSTDIGLDVPADVILDGVLPDQVTDVPDGVEPDQTDALEITPDVLDTPPEVTLDAPEDGAIVDGEVTVEFTATDDNAVAKIEFYVDDELQETTQADPVSGDWASDFAWDTSELPGGDYTLKVVAWDASEQSADDAVTVTVSHACGAEEDCPPTDVSFLQPLSGSVVCGVVPVLVDAHDDVGIATVEFFVDGTSVHTATGLPYGFEWDSSSVEDGEHTLKALVTDTNGSSIFATIVFSVDGVGGACDNFPTVEFTAPLDGQWLAGEVTLAVTAADDQGVAGVAFFVDEVEVAVITEAPFETLLATTDLDDGTHVIEAVVTDTGNQKAGRAVTVNVDNTLPVVTIVAPENDTLLFDNFDFDVTAEDNLTLSTVKLTVGDAEPVELTEGPFLLPVDITDIASGPLTLKAEAVDAAGNLAEASVVVAIDRKPTVEIVAPEALDTVDGTVDFSLVATDDLELSLVQWFVDGEEAYSVDTFTGLSHAEAYALDTTELEYGDHALASQVTDGSGQTAQAEITVTVDQPLVVDIQLCDADGMCADPLDGEEVWGTRTIMAVVDDDNGVITGVEFLVGEESLGTVMEAPFELEVDTTLLAEGDAVLTAVATSDLTIQAQDSMTVVVNNCDKDHDLFDDVACEGDDCNDFDETINTAAEDTVGDEVDNNCDSMDGVDADADNFASVESGGDDCDDAVATTYPGAEDTVGDGVDNNCDGMDGLDADEDGFASVDAGGDDCDDAEATTHPGADDTVGDEVDNNCDGMDGVDADADNFASVESGGDDCDDAVATTYPGAEDTVGDDVDNNCDGMDGVDADADNFASVESGGDDCDDAEATTYPGAFDNVGDGVDNNCDGMDGVDADADGHASQASGGDDCDDSVETTYPGAEDTVGDSVDNNCDGMDGVDADADNFASVESGGDDCDDAEATTHPGAVDNVGDSVDNNCDGVDGTDADEDGYASLETGGDDCDDAVATTYPGAEDTVGDSVDNNCDGVDGVDADLDTYASVESGGDDCDDAEATTHPGADDSVGDLVDNNCDGMDGVDADSDGYASVASGGDDCDDNAALVYPGQPDTVGDGVDNNCDGIDGVDTDGDGYADPDSGGDDCEPNNPDVSPGAEEIAGDGIDQNCDGVDGVDADGDGFAGTEWGGLDCNDDDDAIHPGVADSVGDGVDNNCDGMDGTDADGDGFASIPTGGTDCYDDNDMAYPGATDTVANGVDNNCDGVPGVDGDSDGFASVASGGDDCDDSEFYTHPGAEDTVGDDVDNNCDGVDGLDADGDGFASVALGGTDCDDTEITTYPGALDLVNDGVDNNCDGVDGVDADSDSFASLVSGGTDCDDDNALVYPGAVDGVPNGIDNNCDGIAGVDSDGDGFASMASGGDDCDDDVDSTHPGAVDTVGDGVDNNCDGVDGVDTDGDTFADETSGGTDCDDSEETTYPGATDTVGDGVDNNCDGVDGVDFDGDSYPSVASGGEDCNDENEFINPDASDLDTDGTDQNCDGVDGVDADDDGYPDAATGGDDCNDSNDQIFPGAEDQVGDQVDANCDGIDGEDGDGDGYPGNCDGAIVVESAAAEWDGSELVSYTVPVSIELGITAPAGAVVTTVGIAVGYTHEYWGDLVFDLTSPDGTLANVRDGVGGSTSGPENWTSSNLTHWANEGATGTWILDISDDYSTDDGTISAAALLVYYKTEGTLGADLCDCDDSNPEIHPNHPDVPGDGIDSNCDGSDILDCNDGDPCTADSQDGGTGDCVHTPLGIGVTCDDGVPCTIGDACNASGDCVGVQNPCDDGNDCTTDWCEPFSGVCVNDVSCDDGDPCTLQDTCSTLGICSGTANTCDDDNACTADSCLPDTGDCLHEDIVCNDDEPCSVDNCNPASGCVHEFSLCLEMCGNAFDDDGDTFIDCCDPDCSTAPQCLAETLCNDGGDNDCDGETDCADSDCTMVSPCMGDNCGNPWVLNGNQPIAAADLPVGYELSGDTTETTNDLSGSCSTASASALDEVWRFTLTTPAIMTASMDFDGSYLYPALYLIEGDCGSGTEVACDATTTTPAGFSIVLQPGTYHLVADANYSIDAGPYVVQVLFSVLEESETTCDDFVDNDGDGAVDCADSECSMNPACAGDSCENPIDLFPGILTADSVGSYVVTGDTSGYLSSFAAGCAASSGTARDVLYRFQTATELLIDFEYDFDTATDYPALALFSGDCGSFTELACDATGYNDAPAQFSYIVSPGTYYLLADANSVSHAGAFTVNLEVALVPDTETNCSNGFDDDGDGVADCFDSDCASQGICDGETCATPLVLNGGVPYEMADSGTVVDLLGNTCDNLEVYGNSCDADAENAKDVVFRFALGAQAQVFISHDFSSSSMYPAVSIHDGGACDSLTELYCDATTIQPATIQELLSAGTYYIILDASYAGDCGALSSTLTLMFPTATETECSDGLDNDLDTMFDCCDTDCSLDVACAAESDCEDGLDNDCDSAVDCNDSDCFSNSVCLGESCGAALLLNDGNPVVTSDMPLTLDASGSTSVAVADYSASCSSNAVNSPDHVYELVLGVPAYVTATHTFASGYTYAVLSLKDNTCGETDLLCAANSSNVAEVSGSLAAGTYYLIVSGSASYSSGDYSLSVLVEEIPSVETNCTDGADDDFDTLIDCDDTDCDTNAACVVASLPYEENFDSNPLGSWNQEGAAGCTWAEVAPGNNSSVSGMKKDDQSACSNDQESILFSPRIDFSNCAYVDVSFYEFGNYTSYFYYHGIRIFDEEGTAVEESLQAPGTSWGVLNPVVTLDVTAFGEARFAFVYAGYFADEWSVDDLQITCTAFMEKDCSNGLDDDFDSFTDCDDPDCAGVGDCFLDSDDDGVSDANDVCPGGDDTVDTNANGLADACEIGWAGQVWPIYGSSGNDEAAFTVYLQVFKEGLTEAVGQGLGIEATMNYSFDGAAYQPIGMLYNGDAGNNDEYRGTVPNSELEGAGTLSVTFEVRYVPAPGIPVNYIYDGSITDQSAHAIPIDYTIFDVDPMPTAAGEIVITEIMNNPTGTEGGREWFELYNASGMALNLDGCVIRDDGADSITISNEGTLTIGAGEYLIFANSADLGSGGAIAADYVYGSTAIYLSNSDDELAVVCNTVLIDWVAWDNGLTFPDVEGTSMSLSPSALDSVSNDSGANWCSSFTTSLTGDLGTPGALNDVCL